MNTARLNITNNICCKFLKLKRNLIKVFLSVANKNKYDASKKCDHIALSKLNNIKE